MMNPASIIRVIANALLRKGTYGIARKWHPAYSLVVGVVVGLAVMFLR
jgi:hypothetical protein